MPDQPKPPHRDRKDLFRQALDAANTELTAEYQAASTEAAEGGNLITGTLDAVNSVGLGIAKGAYESADFVSGLFGGGEPNYEDKDPLRRAIEADAAELDRRSPINAIAGDIAQFATGMVGLGKLAAPLKWSQWRGKARVGFEVARGAAAGAIAFDPQEARLSNLIESYPELHNPVTDYLAADLTDSDAEGRLKAALEGIGFDLAITGVLAAAVRVYKAVKTGAPEEVVAQAQRDLEAAFPGGQPTAAGARSVDLMETMEVRVEGLGATDAPRTPVAESGAVPVTDDSGTVIGSRPAEAPASGEPVEITVRGGGGEPAPIAAREIAPEDLDGLMEGWRRDREAIAEYGSREAAEENGYRFGAVGQLPWQKLAADGDLRTFTKRVAVTFKADLDASKGGDVLTDARVGAMVQERVWLYGDDPATLMGMLAQAGEGARAMVANMEASYLIANKALADTYRLASQIRQGSISEFGGDMLAAERALRTRLRLAVDALGNSKAMSAAAGRSLRRMRGEFRVDPETLAKLDTLDLDRLTSLLFQSQGNPKALAKLADPGWLDRALRGTGSIMANNLLWGWPSHVVNTVTSAYMAGIRPAERIVGSYLNGMGSSACTRALREYRYMVASFGDAWEAAVSAFKTGDSVLAPHETEWFKAASQSLDGSTARAGAFVPMRTVGDLLKNGLIALDTALRFPTRALGTVDELIKQTSYRAYIQADASIRADALGLTGRAFRDYVQAALDDAFDASYRATNAEALYEAQVRTFSQPLLHGTLGATLQSAVATHPSLRAIFPFVRTPINVFRYSIKTLPGINLLQREYREMIAGKKGPELQAQALGQMVTGSIALTIAASLTADGKITGGGPRDPKLRAALEATGWKPYSFIRENADGSHTYVPFNRFDPVGMPFGIAADLTEAVLTDPDADIDALAVALVIAVANSLGDKTYLQNVNGFMRAAADRDANAGKWLGQLGENLIPFSSLLRQMNRDPYMREARTMVDHALDRMPGFSDKLPPRRDAFGYPVQVRTGLVFQDNADDIVDAEQMRLILETGNGVLPPTPTREGLDLRDLRLTVEGEQRTAFDLLQELSSKPPGAHLTMKEALAEEIRSERYQMAPDGDGDVRGTKLFLLRRIVGKYREAGYKALLKAYPEEIGKPLAQRALAAREAWRRAREGNAPSGTMSQLSEVAASYGVKIGDQP